MPKGSPDQHPPGVNLTWWYQCEPSSHYRPYMPFSWRTPYGTPRWGQIFSPTSQNICQLVGQTLISLNIFERIKSWSNVLRPGLFFFFLIPDSIIPWHSHPGRVKSVILVILYIPFSVTFLDKNERHPSLPIQGYCSQLLHIVAETCQPL